MNPREKKLAILIGAIAALIIGFVGMKAFFTKPLTEIDKATSGLRGRLQKVQAERRAYFAAEDTVKRFAQQTFSDRIDQASARSGEMLTKQIAVSGLREADFSRLPVGPRKLRWASEIGWSVQGQGGLPEVINLVFLLQESPYLHRIENLAISASEAPGHVRVGFRFLTLMIDPPPAVEIVALEAQVTLESPARRLLEGIVSRDLLRPYIKRPPAAAPPKETAPTPSGPAGLRVVSLSEWMGHPEVHVRDLAGEKTVRHKIGEQLAEGTIVMVDYRPLPMPGNEALRSFSRVILRIGDEYWAVERGQTLADKRRLSADELPESLDNFESESVSF